MKGSTNAKRDAASHSPVARALSIIAAILSSTAVFAGVGQWRTSGPFDSSPTSIVADALRPSTLYVGLSAGQIMKSTDRGAGWSATGELAPIAAAPVGLGSTVLSVDPSNSDVVYAVRSGWDGAQFNSTSNTLYRSDDGGVHWRALTTSSPLSLIDSISVDGADPSTLYLLSAPYHAVPAGRVLKSINGGASFGDLEVPESGFPHQLVLDPGAPTRAYFNSAFDPEFRSEDGGLTWTQVADVVSGVVPDAHRPGLLFTVYADGLYRSFDYGESWIKIPEGPLGAVSVISDPVTPGRYYSVNIAAVIQVSSDFGDHWSALSAPPLPAGASRLTLSGDGRTFFVATSDSLYALDNPLVAACVPDAVTLCLNDGRFRVSVVWEAEHNRTSGPGQAVSLTSDTGAFWFFTPGNLELMVKVVDGRDVNGKFWVFAGALSNVAYTLTVRDTLTGEAHAYVNPQDQLRSVADTNAFDGGREASAVMSAPASPAASPSGCTGDFSTLCLDDSRFRVQVAWEAENLGTNGIGTAVPLTSDSGAFWFFTANNLELLVKVVDGRAFNGHFWVFYGALSNVHYTITVTDTETGTVKVYTNPQGTVASAADTAAF